MIAHLVRSFRFDAAHRLPRLPESHKCSRMHGHGYALEVGVRGPVGRESGWVMDYADIDRAVEPLVASLDHRPLNEIEGLENPTSEILAAWIWERLEGRLPGLEEVVVAETCQARCVFRGERE